MPRYFFHVFDRGRVVEDIEGVELPKLAINDEECRAAIRAVLQDESWKDDLSPESELHVVDEHGRTILVVPFEKTFQS